MLDQIAQALSRHAGPMLVRDVLPAVQQDYASQARVGAAAGRAIGEKLLPWAVIGAGALTVLAIVEVLRFQRGSVPDHARSTRASRHRAR